MKTVHQLQLIRSAVDLLRHVTAPRPADATEEDLSFLAQLENLAIDAETLLLNGVAATAEQSREDAARSAQGPSATKWSWSTAVTALPLTMTLDGVERRFHVRERDNRVAVVLSQPGWAAATDRDFWYVSLEDLGEGAEGKRWRYREGSTSLRGGMSYATALRIARELYEREALK